LLVACRFDIPEVARRDAPADTPADTPGIRVDASFSCKVPASFETNARSTLNTNCGPCHRGTDVGATAAMDLTGVDMPNALYACTQTRLRVNLADITASSIFVATQPGNAFHPFTFGGNAAAHTAFKNALSPWIVAERDAP
jgi:hypothetical protein